MLLSNYQATLVERLREAADAIEADASCVTDVGMSTPPGMWHTVRCRAVTPSEKTFNTNISITWSEWDERPA